MRKLWRRICFLWSRRRLERELAEEMEAHREMMPPHRLAHFGNATGLREESRQTWSWNWLEQFVQDLSYGARVLRRSPGFTLGAIAVLSLGVGANLAEFEIFDAMIFHRFTFSDADSCLQFTHTAREGQRLGFPPAAGEFYRAESRTFAWLVSEDTSLELVVEDDMGLRSNLVSANYFRAFGIVPAWGRLLDERDGQAGAPAVAVLGHAYWQTRWAGDPNVVGRVMRINNHPMQVVGVLPYSFDGIFARGTAIWLSASIRPLLTGRNVLARDDFSRASVTVFGKLRAGVSQAAGEAELTSLTRELARRQPDSFQKDERIQGHPLQESILRSIQHRPPIAIFITLILLVLLSACANLANMLLARGLTRQREIGIRLAIGASRARVVRQLMTENFLLAILGSVAGLATGTFFARFLLFALRAPPGFQISVSWPILVSGFALTFLSALVFGLPSALQAVRSNSRRVHLRRSLVAVQVAVSCLLLIASGVLAHNGIASAAVDLAFDYKHMVAVYPQLYGRNLSVAMARQRLDALSTRMGGLPGVKGITAAVAPPLGGRAMIDSLPGLPHIYRNAVAPTYFNVMDLPFTRGRTFVPGEEDAVIVSESAARAVWPNQDPVGKTLSLAGADRTVVGVVKDSGANLMADADSVEAYLPLQGVYWERSSLVLRTVTDPIAAARLVPSVAATENEAVAVVLMRTAREHMLETHVRLVTLFGSVGVLATALAASGMFALVAFAVAQRRRELGIRIAIGAGRRHILGILVTQNAKPMAAGAIAGAILAVVLSRVARSFIVMQNRDAVDVIGFAGGLACFALVAALATLSPALRALRIDPSTTLRED